MVEDYRYLGVTINNRLEWKSNTEAVYKKGVSRLPFEEAEMFYQSIMACALFFAVVCWGSSVGASDTNKLNKLV